MRRFLADCLVFLVIQASLLAGLETVYQRRLGADHYLAAFRDKAGRLATLSSPRVLLVGGSSLAFGVNSRAIERSLGRPVVNLGLNAGLGLDFILRQAEDAMGPGDLVVLAPEYALLASQQTADARVLLQQVTVAPAAARFVSPRELPKLLDSGLSLVSARLHALTALARFGPPNGIYQRSGFDERGDVVAHHGLASQNGRGAHGGGVPSAAQLSRACERLAALAARARKSGARVVLAPVPIPADDRYAEAGRIAELWSAVARETGIPVLRTDTGYPRDLFLDTAYHLTLAGKRLRTRSLLAAMSGAPGAPQDPP